MLIIRYEVGSRYHHEKEKTRGKFQKGGSWNGQIDYPLARLKATRGERLSGSKNKKEGKRSGWDTSDKHLGHSRTVRGEGERGVDYMRKNQKLGGEREGGAVGRGEGHVDCGKFKRVSHKGIGKLNVGGV